MEAAAALHAPEEMLRARCYGLLATLLGAPPAADLLHSLTALESDGTPLGDAYGALALAARIATPEGVADEFAALFIGLTEGEVIPYGSHYLSGFLHDRPLALLRDDLARLGVARAPGVAEPEDHIAFLCETMAGLIAGSFGAPLGVAQQRCFFDRHLAPWAARFFGDLEAAPSASVYRPVGTLGRHFMDIERDAFGMAG